MSAAARRERRRGTPYLRIVAAIAVGIIVGLVVAFIASNLTMAVGAAKMESKTNGWTTLRQCGEPDNNMLQQASCAMVFPAINLPQEAVYWFTTVDARVMPWTDGTTTCFGSRPESSHPPRRSGR